MRICLIAQEPASWDGPGYGTDTLGRLLSTRHEVRILGSHSDPTLAGLDFAGAEHRRAAELLGTVRAAYPGRGPDYVEVLDHGALGLVLLQARLSGDPLLRDTVVGVRAGPTSDLIAAHDRTSLRAGALRVADLEREQLRLADLLVWPGGGWLDLYREHYGAEGLPRPVRIRAAVERPAEWAPAPPSAPGGPVRMLYAGPLSRADGVLDLAEACFALPFDEWELTIAGGDTETAAMGQSVRATIELMAGTDPRLRIEEGLELEELRRRLPAEDLLVAPSRLGTGATAVLEAMRAGVPVLATPSGELSELVEDGVTGWLAEGSGSAALGRALSTAAGDREMLARVRASGAPGERFAALADPEAVLDGYARLLAEPQSAATAASPEALAAGPLVTGIVPYFRASAYVSEAVESLLGQTHRELEVLIVNDGSFEPEDEVLERLANDSRVTVVTQLNAGESAARALGVRLARGEYVLMLDADNALEPGFVERALLAFRREPELAYVTCWLRYVAPDGSPLPGDPGYSPLGNGVWRADDHNWDGDTLAILPRRLLCGDRGLVDRESAINSDWELYRLLRAEGRLGTVIPERMARYRQLPDSISHGHERRLQERAWEESRVRIDERRTRLSRGD